MRLHVFDPFVPNAPFLYLLKTSENIRGVEKGGVGNEWVKKHAFFNVQALLN